MRINTDGFPLTHPPVVMTAAPEPLMIRMNGIEQDVMQLIERGVHLDVINGIGSRILYIAICHGRPEVVKVLIENGANVNDKTRAGFTPLHLACNGWRRRGRMSIIRQLIQHGADVNARTNVNTPEPDIESDIEAGGRTPLHNAVLYGNIQAIRMLLRHGADISIGEGEGFNSLHWAIEGHNRTFRSGRSSDRRGFGKAVKIIQILLAHGTVYDRVDYLNATAGYSPMKAVLVDGLWTEQPNTTENAAHDPFMKEMLRAALVQAHEERRAMLDAFTMGQHKRLGAASYISHLDPEVVQMVLDRV